MEAVVFEERLRGLLRERRLGLLVLALSLFLNLFLAFSAARNREQVVLLPITGFEGRWMVSPTVSRRPISATSPVRSL